MVTLASSLPASGDLRATSRSPSQIARGDLAIVGGVEPIARLLELDPTGPRALFLLQVIRRIYDAPWGSRENAAELLPGLLRYIDRSELRAGITEYVPLPLGPAVWSDTIFRGAVSPDTLFRAILHDREASLLYHGLAALDGPTLGFLGAHPQVLRDIYRGSAPAFATLARSLHIENGELQVPGGAVLRPGWEALVGEPVSRTDRFITTLLARDDGRLAFFFDTLAHLDAPRLRFATRRATGGAADREPLRSLYEVFKNADPAWKIANRPFARTAFDCATLLMTIEVGADGELVGPRSRRLWEAVFASDDESRAPERDLREAPGAATVDAVWLASRIGLSEPSVRQQWVETLRFSQRAFGRAVDAALPDLLVALRGFRRYPMLAVTLDRLGVQDPRLYARATRHVSRLANIDDSSLTRTRLIGLQASMALLERLVFRGVLDARSATDLVGGLLDLTDGQAGRETGHVAQWLVERLLPRLTGRARDREIESPELALLRGLAGLPVDIERSPRPNRMIEWEGSSYRVAVAESTFRRLEEARQNQGEGSVDEALAFIRESRVMAVAADRVQAMRGGVARLRELVGAPRSADSDRTADGRALSAADVFERLASRIDVLRPHDAATADEFATALGTLGDRILAESLASLVYACSLMQLDVWIPETRELARRHDLGLVSSADARARAPWQLPVEISGPAVRWHFRGSLLGLDIVLAPMSLRRISTEPPARAPKLNENDRATFVQSVVLLNPLGMTDGHRDAIAAGLKRGRERVRRVALHRDELAAAADEIDLSEWRRRAAEWIAVHEPDHLLEILSQRELLALGSAGEPEAFDEWGLSAIPVDGSFRTRLAGVGPWENLSGRPTTGQLAALVPDLNLRVAEVLADRRLPAELAAAVLAPAVQSLIDDVQPAYIDDWLAFVTYVRKIPDERFDDYISSLTADGPLVAESTGSPAEQR